MEPPEGAPVGVDHDKIELRLGPMQDFGLYLMLGVVYYFGVLVIETWDHGKWGGLVVTHMIYSG